MTDTMSTDLDINPTRAQAEAIRRKGQEFINYLHDLDKSRRGSHAFNDPWFVRAKTLVEDAVAIATRDLPKGE